MTTTVSLQTNMAHKNVQFGWCSNFPPLFLFFFVCVLAEHALPTLLCPPPPHSQRASKALTLAVLAGGSHVHIVAISFPADSGVTEKETGC